MDIIAGCSERAIHRIIDPTVAAFAPLLKKKKEFIKEIPFQSFKFSPIPRSMCDVYYPPSTPSPTGKAPILFFIYGGGFNSGERRISPATFGLVYANVAAFFARRGHIVIIPDYRLVPWVNFPGPSVDLREAVKWALANPQHLSMDGSPEPDYDQIYMMGHSAGALHIITMFAHPMTVSQVDEIRKRVKGIILQSPPYDLSSIDENTVDVEVYKTFWGHLETAKANDPVHLYRHIAQERMKGMPRMLMVEAEWEPQWLLDAGVAFAREVKERLGEPPRKVVARGHNHISHNWALCTGEGEEWAEEVVEWMRGVQEETATKDVMMSEP
ncbi:alpha/beta hydrolase domain-containing protein [Panaeolus papilionaceus]|nr:alpha/beta hydrolase domain-containing protein [Panaeolus papilionaceus]